VDLSLREHRVRSRGQVGPLAAGPEAVGRMQEDPAALRLELLSRRYADPVDLSADAGAEQTLRRWRARMSDWARSPSRPIPPPIRQRAEANFTDDLDTPSVLQLLREIEADQNLPNGAKVESFAYLDRVLALELARDIGH
jgi:cysteinyl-tRNA synthetase